MKLDDRPVIDQLLNPTPQSIVRDVEREVCDRTSDAEASLYAPLRELLAEHIKPFRTLLEGARDACREALDQEMHDFLSDAMAELDDAIQEWSGMAAAHETDRTLEAVRFFANELENRL